MALARHLGAPADDPALAFPLGAQDRAAWAGRPTSWRCGRAATCACIRAGAKRESVGPHTSLPRWRMCWRLTGLPVVLTGSGEEAALTGAVRRAMRSPVLDAAEAVPVGALASLIAGSRLLITNDTGTSHLRPP